MVLYFHLGYELRGQKILVIYSLPLLDFDADLLRKKSGYIEKKTYFVGK